MEEKTVSIPQINCEHCVTTIKREIGGLSGIVMIDGNRETREVTIAWQAPATWATITQTLTEIGFPPSN